MKANGNERIRLHADGNTAGKDTLVTEQLRVTGTTRIDSIHSRHIRAERITSMMPGDSLIFFGDSSIVFNHQQHHIFAYNHYRTVIGGSPGQAMDLKIQCQPLPVVGSTPGTNHTFLNTNRGNVGIGLGQFGGAPAAKLHVAGDVRITGTKLHVAQNGNVGIGTSSPDARLDVSDLGGNPALRVFSDGAVTIGPFLTQTNPSATLYLGDDRQHYIRSNWNEGLSFNTYGAVDAIVIREGTGRVGIGTNNPLENLHIQGFQAKLRVGESDNYLRMGYDGSHSIIDNYGSTLMVNYYSGNDVAFGAPSTEGGGNISVKIFGDLEICDKLNVLTSDFCDYVFSPEYERPSLEEKEAYYRENRHLFGVPSESEIIENGMDIAQIIKGLTLNLEELSLYQIDLYKMLLEVKEENRILKEQVQLLSK
jgi:hypothetical protein